MLDAENSNSSMRGGGWPKSQIANPFGLDDEVRDSKPRQPIGPYGHAAK
jgi:hypothetical protein